ncbi:hypothetical protein CHLRE_03g208555v5 [Chlamydomonas reinhardtii]|uniref:Uncharacterized protein n=1 Tax=Chlamydomonas reinhardtii TaxID=3055 RepID=A0A2K3DYU7_CHLRE|nr:uncharacterized protein CHLRE_03g208555v5 [Chlamydomonas reinhardtii]PNW85714.1 hypothetical protein CHLRE_03g208555v5 [Chlamydomonas reinhardtii]
MGLGRFAHLTGPCPHTGVPFTTGAVTHLGVPLSWDSDAAAADLYTRRARGMAFVARLWAALSLTLVGRVHVAKQVLAAKLAYHFSFLNPSPAQLKELTDLVDHFAARSVHAEDASLVSHGNPLLLPKRETACLPYKDGGVNHVDLPAFLSALQAKTFALLAQPGRQPWKTLTRALLTHVRPDSATTWAWVYSDAPAPAGLPARLAAAVGHVRSAGVEQHPPQPATQPPAAPPQWRVSLDQLWVANAAGAVSYVHYTGRLLEPGPGVLPPAVDGAWQPACVLQHRKPRHLWTFEERAAYDAASPGERAGAWPRAPYFLAPEAGVVVHPEHCRIAGVSLADYTVRDVRRAITAANPAAPLAPARPAAMPCPAPAQQAGGSGTQPAAQSRLAEREAEWQRAAAQLTTTAAQHFHNNPVALDPWLHRTSAAAGQQNTPARTLQSYASPSQQSGEGPRRSARLQEQAAGGAGPSTGPATAAAAAAAAVEGDPRMPPPDASLLRGTWRRLWDSHASRGAKVLVYRLQHAYLPCGLYRAGKGIRPRVTTGCGGLGAHCPHPACGPPGPRAWASLTHIFLECPAYAQARTWLQQLWACVAPQAAAPPVTDAGFMLGDRMGMWASGPRGAGALLWSTLRATFLYAVWCAYWSREPAKQTSEHVVREVVSELRRVMQLRFTAATLTPETLSALPTQLLTAQLKAAKLEHFVAIWSAGGALCEVEEVQADLFTRRARGMAFVARLWAALSLTLVGRVHIAKKVLAAKLAYHFSFLNPSPAQLKELTDLVDHFAARSVHAEDASLVSHGNPLLLPKRETACLPYKDGGVNHVDLPAFLSALQAKTFALLAQPGRQPWKTLTRALLTHVRPDSATTWAWVYSDAPAPAGLPARLAAAVGHVRSAGVEQHPPQPATQPPAAPPQWRVSLDQLWVANAAGAVSYVHYTGRLLEPGPGVLPPAVDGAWQPACVLQHRKPRHLWTFEERAAYDAASPGERAGAWPRAPYFLAPEAGVVVHPEHCRIAGVSLADYTVRDVRRAITAANPAAPLAPARPAAMPCPAPAQQAGGSGTQPAAQSRLAEREAEWQRAAAQLTTTAAQHFHNNPVALDPWLHRTSAAAGQQNTPARTLQSYASPSQQSGEGPRRSARLQEQAAGGAGPSTGPATAAAAAAAAVEGDPRMPPPDASLLRAYAQARTWLQQLWACVAPQAAAPPVTDAGFMLGDRMGMWASGPRGAGALLWSTLRATFLYAVWCAYWSREPAKQTSEHVVREVVSELRRVMQLRFTAATLTPETLSALPTQLLTAQLKAAKLEHFVAIWTAGGALCEVEEVQGGSPKLHLRLTLASPVQAP